MLYVCRKVEWAEQVLFSQQNVLGKQLYNVEEVIVCIRCPGKIRRSSARRSLTINFGYYITSFNSSPVVDPTKLAGFETVHIGHTHSNK